MVLVRHYLLPLLAVLFMQLLQPLHDVVAHSDGHEKAFVECEYCAHAQDIKSATLVARFTPSVAVAAIAIPETALNVTERSVPVALARGPPAV